METGAQREDCTEGVQAPAHARVLPSFLVEQLKRPFNTWLGVIEPIELVHWTRKSLPPSTVVNELRVDALRRLRQRSPELWVRPMGITLAANWSQWLQTKEASLIQKVIEANPGRDFGELSFVEVKQVVKKPAVIVIGLLAAVEAAEWTPPPFAPHRRPERDAIRRFDDTTPVELTERVRELAQRALSLPWVTSIPEGDLRLQAPGGAAPLPWVREQLEQQCVSSHLEPVLQAIVDAEEMSYAAEVHALASAAIFRCHPSPGPGNENRWVSMFTARYVGPATRTLQEIGQDFGVTRERVRQVCESILEVVRAKPTSTPALDRVLRMAARSAPCALEDADEQLAKHLGAGCGVQAALEFAGDIGRPLPVRIGRVKVRVAGRYEDAPLLESTVDGDRWPQTVLRYAAAECVTLGCTSILRMAGALALRDGVAPGQEAMVSVFRNAPGFRWLDESNGWFSIGDTNTCGAANRLRKILAVAHEAVSVDEVAEAFAADTRWFRTEDDRALAVPPTHVIQAMVSGWPWVKAVQYTRLVAEEPIPLEGTLSDIEKKVVELIEANAGVAAAWQLYGGVLECLPVTKIAVAFALSSSAMLVRLEHGLYTLRGRRIKTEALDKARQALSQRFSGASYPSDADSFRVRVTAAALRNEQYTVPVRFMGKLAGRVVGIEGSAFQARVTQSGSMKGLNQCFDGLSESDELEVTLVGERIAVRRVPAEQAASVGGGDGAIDDEVGAVAVSATKYPYGPNPDELAQ